MGSRSRASHPDRAAAALGDQGFFAWHGNFYALGLIEALGLAPAGMLRVGFLHYNTADEVARLSTRLKDFDKLLSRSGLSLASFIRAATVRERVAFRLAAILPE